MIIPSILSDNTSFLTEFKWVVRQVESCPLLLDDSRLSYHLFHPRDRLCHHRGHLFHLVCHDTLLFLWALVGHQSLSQNHPSPLMDPYNHQFWVCNRRDLLCARRPYGHRPNRGFLCRHVLFFNLLY